MKGSGGKAKRVLIWLKPTYLGDTVMATPVLDQVSDALLPDRPVVLTGRVSKQVLLDRSDKALFLEGYSLANPYKFFRQVRVLRALRIDTAILVNRSFR